VTTPEFDPEDPLFRPISMRAAMDLTGRSDDTLNRWIRQGHLRVVRLSDPPEDVLIEREVVDAALAKRRAARQGRPRPKRGESPDGGVDVSA
jgi:hypothetical protein